MDKGNTINEEKKLHIELFGGFSISYGGKVYLKDNGSSKKVMNILQYLIINKNNKVSYDNLVYAMKLDEGNKNPTAVLKNLIYRVRTLLKVSGLPDLDYILQTSGTYSWNNDIECVVDVELFQDYCKKAQDKDKTDEEKLEFYNKAIKIYGGKLLPKNAVELWIVPLTTYYDSVFSQCIKECYGLVKKNGDYSAMIHICSKAIEIDPYDEKNYVMLIECYCKLEKYKDALAAYEKITDLIYEELGVKPSEELIEFYKDIMSNLNQVEKNLVVIDGEIREDSEEPNGAYYCPYGMFKSMAQYTMRMFERTGQSLCMALFTVTDPNGGMPPKKKRLVTMDNLKDTINTSLRRGDLFSRYSATQYIVMLVSADYENSCKVGQRIMDKYNSKFFARTTKITYKVKVMNISK
ncbi:MAG: bacterial transcriptional activator domain-containing protein [Anaerotignaceae bacterium]